MTNWVTFSKITGNKAGMEGLDKETIAKIIRENSKGSKFYENEFAKEREIQRQMEEKLAQSRQLTAEQLTTGCLEGERIVKEFLSRQDSSRTFVHIDMDAFYASVELRDRSDLRDKPMAVGSNMMLSTSNYLARRYGVRSAMPGFIGKKLCPNLVIIEPDFVKYSDVSKNIRRIMTDYADPKTGLVTMSLDEAYLEITEHVKLRASLSNERRTFQTKSPAFGTMLCRCPKEQRESVLEKNSKDANKTDERLLTCIQCLKLIKPGIRTFGTDASELVHEMRYRIYLETMLTSSGGIACNTLLAKIASDVRKPNGLYYIEADELAVRKFIENLAIRKVPGIGYVTERKLSAFNIKTCRDLYDQRGILYNLFSRTAFLYYMRISVGYCDDSEFSADDPLGEPNFSLEDGKRIPEVTKKSMSCERTFKETSEISELLGKLRQLCTELVSDIADAHVKGRTLTVKLKLDSFKVRTRAQTMLEATDDFNLIYDCAKEILNEEVKNFRRETGADMVLRLMGVRISNLISAEICPPTKQLLLSNIFGPAMASIQQPEPVPSMPTETQEKSITVERDEIRSVACPICNKNVDIITENDFNIHLDKCLLGDTTSSLYQVKPELKLSAGEK